MQKIHESVRALFVAALVLFAGGPVEAQQPPKRIQWVGSWATAQQLPEPRNSLATEDLQDATLRQIVHLSLGGNRLLLDGLGPNALAHFDRDVLAQAGVRCVIVLEGVNDLGMLTHAEEVPKEQHDELVHGIIGAYEQIIERAHAHGIRVIGATIMPYSGSDFYHPNQLNEEDRQGVNRWIRTSGRFDAVADFDKVTQDPKQPNRLLPEYDSGDHLHPSPAGFRRMSNEIPLKLLEP